MSQGRFGIAFERTANGGASSVGVLAVGALAALAAALVLGVAPSAFGRAGHTPTGAGAQGFSALRDGALGVDPAIAQTAELTASDGAANDTLGYSVAVSGSTIVVGARTHTVGSNAGQGAVYVYTLPASGAWASATQTAELIASDGTAANGFGYAVAISGSTIVVGAPESNTGQGAVYVYTLPASGVWANATQTAELTAADGAAGDRLGSAVAISGSTIVAGAPGHEVGANDEQGAAYVYTLPGSGVWANATANAELVASDGSLGDLLGTSVAVDGSTIVAGAPMRDSVHGAAYVYAEPTGGWSSTSLSPTGQTAELTASDGAADMLGESVALSGSTIVAGAPYGNGDEGVVLVYVMPAGGWANATQTAALSASDGAAGRECNGPLNITLCLGDQLGASVALSGPTIVAGAPGHDSEAGAVYAWSEPSTGWANATQSAELANSDASTGNGCIGGPLEGSASTTLNAPGCIGGDQLGHAVAVSGSTIVGGAGGHEIGSNLRQGAAYAFEAVTSATVSLALSPASITDNGTSTTTATFTVDDVSGTPVSDDAVTIASSAGQTVGPVTAGSTPGTYRATITSTTNAGSATITATDTSVTPNPTATATLTQTEAANSFTISSGTAGSDGTLTVGVDLPGAGTIYVLGTHEDVTGGIASARLRPGHHRFAWGTHGASVTQAGTIRLTLHPDANGRKLIARHRSHHWALYVHVAVTYNPIGGRAHTKVRSVRVL